MATITYYKNPPIVTLKDGETATFNCEGKAAKTDIVIDCTSNGAVRVTSSTSSLLPGTDPDPIQIDCPNGKKLTLNCKGKRLRPIDVENCLTYSVFADDNGPSPAETTVYALKEQTWKDYCDSTFNTAGLGILDIVNFKYANGSNAGNYISPGDYKNHYIVKDDQHNGVACLVAATNDGTAAIADNKPIDSTSNSFRFKNSAFFFIDSECYYVKDHGAYADIRDVIDGNSNLTGNLEEYNYVASEAPYVIHNGKFLKSGGEYLLPSSQIAGLVMSTVYPNCKITYSDYGYTDYSSFTIGDTIEAAFTGIYQIVRDRNGAAIPISFVDGRTTLQIERMDIDFDPDETNNGSYYRVLLKKNNNGVYSTVYDTELLMVNGEYIVCTYGAAEYLLTNLSDWTDTFKIGNETLNFSSAYHNSWGDLISAYEEAFGSTSPIDHYEGIVRYRGLYVYDSDNNPVYISQPVQKDAVYSAKYGDAEFSIDGTKFRFCSGYNWMSFIADAGLHGYSGFDYDIPNECVTYKGSYVTHPDSTKQAPWDPIDSTIPYCLEPASGGGDSGGGDSAEYGNSVFYLDNGEIFGFEQGTDWNYFISDSPYTGFGSDGEGGPVTYKKDNNTYHIYFGTEQQYAGSTIQPNMTYTLQFVSSDITNIQRVKFNDTEYRTTDSQTWQEFGQSEAGPQCAFTELNGYVVVNDDGKYHADLVGYNTSSRYVGVLSSSKPSDYAFINGYELSTNRCSFYKFYNNGYEYHYCGGEKATFKDLVNTTNKVHSGITYRTHTDGNNKTYIVKDSKFLDSSLGEYITTNTAVAGCTVYTRDTIPYTIDNIEINFSLNSGGVVGYDSFWAEHQEQLDGTYIDIGWEYEYGGYKYRILPKYYNGVNQELVDKYHLSQNTIEEFKDIVRIQKRNPNNIADTHNYYLCKENVGNPVTWTNNKIAFNTNHILIPEKDAESVLVEALSKEFWIYNSLDSSDVKYTGKFLPGQTWEDWIDANKTEGFSPNLYNKGVKYDELYIETDYDGSDISGGHPKELLDELIEERGYWIDYAG